ncbi:MAG: hypothetical protein ACYCXP_13335 [Leptospirillum sp.]
MEMQLDNVTGNHRIAVTIREFSQMLGLSGPSIRGYLMRDPSKLPPTFRVGYGSCSGSMTSNVG